MTNIPKALNSLVDIRAFKHAKFIYDTMSAINPQANWDAVLSDIVEEYASTDENGRNALWAQVRPYLKKDGRL